MRRRRAAVAISAHASMERAVAGRKRDARRARRAGRARPALPSGLSSRLRPGRSPRSRTPARGPRRRRDPIDPGVDNRPDADPTSSSSAISRATQPSGVSPGSSLPPGSSHSPRGLPTSTTRPSRSNTPFTDTGKRGERLSSGWIITGHHAMTIGDARCGAWPRWRAFSSAWGWRCSNNPYPDSDDKERSPLSQLPGGAEDARPGRRLLHRRPRHRPAPSTTRCSSTTSSSGPTGSIPGLARGDARGRSRAPTAAWPITSSCATTCSSRTTPASRSADAGRHARDA